MRVFVTRAKVVSKSPEEANKYFDWFAHFAALDNPTSSERTREVLEWQLEQPGVNFRYR